ncbi:hypothetical protein QEP66_01025 [Streptomyces sp. LB8]|uniref:hypothetical protein n=1 Tax=Streptomyces sp. LB8 TaxID=3042509 RepID=UPI002649366F|nr:hypothetical protein [Streptomyces sp. LB8]MDN5380713.1 hypothetical protein [Streptomyces sp. LB8]
MDTYSVRGARTQITGHYRRPGTRELYCGRPVGSKNGIFAAVRGWKLCGRCVKALAADRAAAEQTAAQHRTTPDPLDQWRATLAYGARVYDPVRRQAGTVINARKHVRLPHGGAVRGTLVEFPHGVVRVPLTELHPVPADDRAAVEERAAVDDEAADTWRAAWIGEHTSTTAPALFNLPAEQGALFT